MEILILDWSYSTSPVTGFGDAHPDGRYCCLMPGRADIGRLPTMAIRDGTLPCPENAIYPRLPEAGSRILALGHASDHAMEWQGDGWVYSTPAFGPWAVIYGAGDVPTVLGPPGPASGYRYLEPGGAIRSCTSTYVDPDRQINEYTDLNGVAIGQGVEAVGEGAVIHFPGEPNRRLEPRPNPTYPWRARFMHTRWVGDKAAITIVDQDRRKTYFVWTSKAELWWLQPVVEVPAFPPLTFQFTHPVIVAPFMDPQGDSGAPAEILVNGNDQLTDRPCFVAGETLAVFADRKGPLLGVYTEGAGIDHALDLAEALETRVLVAHDSPADWTLPAGLRPWDILTLEFYRVKTESLQESGIRWARQLADILARWPGDLGVIPQFYCQGGAPPNELWTVAEVLDGLRVLSDLVNRSPRIKIIAPFAWQRANGIVAHRELREAFVALVGASAAVGLATLHPVGAAPPPPPPPSPPEEPSMVNLSLHDWTRVEWPQVVAARRTALNDPTWEPNPDWVILQMARRYGLGLAPGEPPWTLRKMLDHELRAEGGAPGPGPVDPQ